ncbi:MAG: glycosyltransferase [Chloroflexi bacterium]|nr:glycosyltransferase [Chloroflexota bacterium]
MKALHINTDESRGGAARSANRLYAAQRIVGTDARMLVLRRSTRDPNVDSVPLNRLQRLIRRRVIHLDRPSKRAYPEYRGGDWSTGRVSTPVLGYLERARPDVVNLHWLGGGMLSVEALARIRAPIVWTLHDMWAVTGGCHYAGSCVLYRTGCGSCPQLRSTQPRDISASTWERKRRSWRDLNLTIVTPSRWLADIVKESPILGGYRTEVIPNAIDTQVFRPFNAAFARCPALATGQDADPVRGAAHRRRAQGVRVSLKGAGASAGKRRRGACSLRRVPTGAGDEPQGASRRDDRQRSTPRAAVFGR